MFPREYVRTAKAVREDGDILQVIIQSGGCETATAADAFVLTVLSQEGTGCVIHVRWDRIWRDSWIIILGMCVEKILDLFFILIKL